jgi:hypothetical protein
MRSGMGNKLRSGSGIRVRDEYFGSYFEELINYFWVKIHKFFDVDADPDQGIFSIRDGKNSDPGSGINIPDSQH